MINQSKKLPCGHIFHTTCLRSWFQRQQTCPTCRLNILRTPPPDSTAVPHNAEQPAAAEGNAAAAGAAAAAANAAAGAPQAANVVEGRAHDRDVPTARFEGIATPGPRPASNGVPNFVPPIVPPFVMPTPFPFIAPYAVAPPPMPPDLHNLSLEELQAMEGNERQHIEQRIKWLQNIKLMLDASSVLMNNYQLIAARYPLPTTAAQSVGTAAATTTTTTTNTGNAGSSTSTISFVDSSLNEQPSTSAAAAAAVATAAAEAVSINKSMQDKNIRGASVSITEKVPVKVAAQNIITANTKELHNKNEVTIEDLGVEEHIDDVATKATITQMQTESNDFENGTEMNELRKRRLKYLEELSKTTPTTTSTSTTSPNE